MPDAQNDPTALRWCDIVAEEYAALDPAPGTARAATPERLEFSQADLQDFGVLQDELAKLKPIGASEITLAALSCTRLALEKLRLWLCQPAGATEPPRSMFHRPSGAPSGVSLNPDEITRGRVVDCLNRRLQDTQLARTEEWLRDMPLRPYTRGLLAAYDHNARANVQKLNRYLLEDAFPRYLVRREEARTQELYDGACEQGYAALCLSGGGIRSATFALGLLQGLARGKLLPKFHYLSTVSGGGYLGGWLSAWIARVGGLGPVAEELGARPASPLDPEPDPVRHLRAYSNYLSPQLGLLSADTWTLVATYVRNLVAQWIVILPLLGAIIMVPWVSVSVVNMRRLPGALAWVSLAVLLLGAAVCLIVAVFFVHGYRPETASNLTRAPAPKAKRDQRAFLTRCLTPLVLATILLTWAWAWMTRWQVPTPEPLVRFFTIGLWEWPGRVVAGPPGIGTFAVAGALIHLVGWSLAVAFGYQGRARQHRVVEGVVVAITGVMAGCIVWGVGRLIWRTETSFYVWLALPSVLATVLVAGFVFEGLASRWTGDAEREWSARYSAWVLVVLGGWLVFGGLVLYGPKAVAEVAPRLAAALGLGSGVGGALLGWSSKTAAAGKLNDRASGKPSPKLPGLQVISKLGLPVLASLAVGFLVVFLSWGDTALIKFVCDRGWRWLGTCGPGAPFLGPNHAWDVAALASSGIVLSLLVLLAGIGLGLGAAIDTNRFSLHAMYRARLIRAYLGASRPQGERNPDPFTGFDEQDNLYMSQLPRKPPLHVVNLALNLVHGRNLAWQERKAESFTVTPLHAGSSNLGYRRTSLKDRPDPKQTDDRYYGGDNGISLGTAMTISGAAASPNMGYHSSAAITFLMALFNARLGWWLGNPGPAGNIGNAFHKRAPSSSILPIVNEMFGRTNDDNRWVYLSDGGHFENLGLYEMVGRRCRFIVVSDASCDEDCSLADLGNAIRKVRIDFGVPIEFGEFPITSRAKATKEGRYWAFARIRYSLVDRTPEESDGLLLYIKPGIYGGEPQDIFNYAQVSAAFPHESTGDQFFSETQFESYRALGAHIAEKLMSEVDVLGLFTAQGRSDRLARPQARPLDPETLMQVDVQRAMLRMMGIEITS